MNRTGLIGADVVATHTFGPLQFRTRGLGVYFVQKDGPVQRKIDALSVGELRAANRAAWAIRNRLTRFLNRVNNVTVHGWHDAEEAQLDVSTAICKATWAALQRA
jgi:hypothetical protein